VPASPTAADLLLAQLALIRNFLEVRIRTLRLIQPGISFDYPNELRRKAEGFKYGLFGADRKIIPLSAADLELNAGRGQRAGTVHFFSFKTHAILLQLSPPRFDKAVRQSQCHLPAQISRVQSTAYPI
jgi:hypothetical protein